MAADPWPIIHAERQALVADLQPLTDAQWATQSLCSEWTVRDVLAHMTATARMTPPRFMGHFIGSGFRFNAMTQKDVLAERGDTPADTLAGFKSRLDATTHPPGPINAMVAEAVIHSYDIRHPLGMSRTYPDDALTTVGTFVTSGNLLLGGKRRAQGLTLRATDVAWTHGSGPEVSGPMISLIMALVGRPAGLEQLEGDGVATLKERV
jgi:uncharacterized protein (TIGR03083 family)